MKLNDTFSLEGKGEKKLMEDLSIIDSDTVTKTVNPLGFTIYSVESVTKDGIKCLVIDPDYMDSQLLFPLKRPATYFSPGEKHYGLYTYSQLKDKMGLSEEIISEIREVGYFLKYSDVGDERILLVPSKAFMSTFCRQLGVGKLPELADPIREVFIGYLLREKEDDFSITYREAESYGKVFSANSEKYTTIAQTEAVKKITDCLKEKVAVSVDYYKITHYRTKIKMSLPELTESKVKIGVLLSFSEVGDESYSLQLGVTIRGIFFKIGSPITRSHRGEVDFKGLVDEFLESSKNQIESLKYCLSHLDNEVKKDSVGTVITFLNLQKAIGINACKVLPKDYKEVNNGEELLYEVIRYINSIPLKVMEIKGKPLPESAVEKIDKAAGQMFTLSKCKKVFGWE